MKRAEKAVRILTMLDELYPEPPIPLDHEDPFTLLVAVALSAQTTDERVNQVTPGLFAKARLPLTQITRNAGLIIHKGQFFPDKTVE